MPRPKDRSTSIRKLFRKTAKGTKEVYKRRAKKQRHSCAVCGAESKKTSRKFSQVLCHACAERVLVIRARLKEGYMKASDVPIDIRRFI
ncbi:MAG: hypothetical protein QW035_00580 [Candidatus Anstonellales archaeon]